jgi:predicted transcriptional regulator
MGRAATIEQAVARAVALRRVAAAVSDPVEARRLARVQRELRREIGFSVPKTRAAALLGVSVAALDRWIAAGRLPTVRRPGAAREEIDADAVVELALEVERLREQGVQRGVLAAAFERLAAEGKPKRRPRPNMSARELRADFLSSTPLERLRTGAALSEVATLLAGRARMRRQT